MDHVLPPDLGLVWASPAWRTEGVALMFERRTPAPRLEVRQQMLRLTSTLHDPYQAAEAMTQRLLATAADDWADSFG